MIKLILVGVWACLATFASSYATTYLRTMFAKSAVEQKSADVDSRKTKEINIPKIRDGSLRGYVVAEFAYSVNMAAQKKTPVSPDPFVVDEAFRYIFNDDSIALGDLQKYDLQKLTDTIAKNVNARLKADIVSDVTIQEFTFLTATEVKQHL
jgi:hypothetical protein